MGQIVVPIFYHVDPSEVRTQTGSFAEAFDAHEERFKNNLGKVQSWRTSLTQVANLSGFHLQDRYESDFIQEIIEKILSDWIRTLPMSPKTLWELDLVSRNDEDMFTYRKRE
ncbi:hypothetical protein M0R45_008215 [Rubus argutus]|uniref:TIR domain-containing protein n=1 Tax=Rubus argutus TaxID=59490 RepID=A0AAW1Y484_RUBAR